jgi:hypothetical protein
MTSCSPRRANRCRIRFGAEIILILYFANTFMFKLVIRLSLALRDVIDKDKRD